MNATVLPRFVFTFFLGLGGFSLQAPSAVAEFETDVLHQVSIGALKLDDQAIHWSAPANGAAEGDFTTLPIVGVESEYVFQRGWVHWGINSGGSLAWKDSALELTGSRVAGGASQRTVVDSSLLLAELHVGGYVRGRLHERITTYAAAGPMLLYGRHELDDQSVFDASGNVLDGETVTDASDSSAFNLGYYARAGIDFEIQKNQHLGVGFRYVTSDLDLDDTVGTLDIEGPQIMFTFSTRM